MKYTIEDLKNGKCSVKNDGTLDELKEVLRLAFNENGIGLVGNMTNYSLDSKTYLGWRSINNSHLPSQSVKDFLNTESENKETFNPQSYYKNDNGSLYKIAEKRGWNNYTFDVIKRLDSGGKKDPLRQEIEKSIDVLKLWLLELDD